MIEIFELAERKNMIVSEMIERMSYSEMLGWIEYYRMRPVGWREDLRTSLLMQQQGMKEKPQNIFPSLKAIQESREEIPTEARLAQTLKSSGLLFRLQQAAANNGVQWLDDKVQSDNPEGPRA
jgi:hypothetical protein